MKVSVHILGPPLQWAYSTAQCRPISIDFFDTFDQLLCRLPKISSHEISCLAPILL
jgi:hypothetical protein